MKLPENDLSPEVAAAWDSIATLGILPMNEPYNSQTFLALADAAAVAEVPETIPAISRRPDRGRDHRPL